jgi:predicted GIY-YIG superfamily endonuclease
MLANGFHGTLYTGVTSNLPGRIWQHRNEVMHGFTSRYGDGSAIGKSSLLKTQILYGAI